jgi:hypothetical protein
MKPYLSIVGRKLMGEKKGFVNGLALLFSGLFLASYV